MSLCSLEVRRNDGDGIHVLGGTFDRVNVLGVRPDVTHAVRDGQEIIDVGENVCRPRLRGLSEFLRLCCGALCGLSGSLGRIRVAFGNHRRVVGRVKKTSGHLGGRLGRCGRNG